MSANRPGAIVVLMESALLTLLLAGLVQAAAPKVIKAVPAHEATDVDCALTEIYVVFDQDMQTDRFSWVGGGPTFPELTGKPSWRDARTAVLPVKLEPAHAYQLWINSAKHQNFLSKAGEPAEVYPLHFTTAAGGAAKPLTRAQNRAAIDSLRKHLERDYSYYELRKVDWDKAFRQHRAALEQATSPAAFAVEAGKLLATAQDMHIWLKADGQTYASHRRNVQGNVNPATVERVVPNWQKRSEFVYTGRFDDGIGYVAILNWSGGEADPVPAVLEALREWRDAPGVVIDVRPNSGGDEQLAQQVAGCFVDEPVVYAQHVNRDADAPGGFSEAYRRELQPNRNGPAYRGKVAVLMGPRNMSSCEAFLLMMKQVPGCRLVGGQSYGSSGNPKPYDLGNGVTVYLPSWKAMTADGTCFEGEGIAPDIPVSAEPGDFKHTDPVLDAALRYLRGSK